MNDLRRNGWIARGLGHASLVQRYGLALALTAAAAVTVWALAPWLGRDVALPYIVAAAVSARFGGLGPGLLTLGLCLLLSTLVFSPPGLILTRDDSTTLGRLGLFALHLGLVVWLGEEQRRAAAERHALQTVIEQAPVSMVIARAPDGHIELLNREAGRYWDASTLAAAGSGTANASRQHTPGPAVPSFPPLVAALRGEEVRDAEIRMVQPSGGERVLLVNASPILGEDGAIRGAVAAGQDITERKTLDQLKTEFLSLAAHELKTPLTVLKGSSQMLLLRQARGQLNLAPCDQQTLRIMDQRTGDILRLVNGLLDFFDVEAGAPNLRLRPVDLTMLIRDLVRQQQATHPNHTFVIEGMTAPIVGTWDLEQLERLFISLLDNAVKHGGGGTWVRVAVQERAGYAVRIDIQDQGIGIPAEDLPHIFALHRRARNLARGATGLGLGLYLAKAIVSQHGGKIWVESVEGQGSTFRIELPLHGPQLLAETPEKNDHDRLAG